MKSLILVALCVTLACAMPQRFPVQQFPNDNNIFFPVNNGNNCIFNNGNCVLPTTSTPSPVLRVTTASPQFLACLQACPSTMEYNPICGTDNQNYHNSGRLTCAQRCGKNLVILNVYGYPQLRHPNSEYELINPENPAPHKHLIALQTTPRNVVINTPPPPPLNSKTFVYDPVAKTWTKVKNNDPQPSEDTLLWNQSNDKWLTMVS